MTPESSHPRRRLGRCALPLILAALGLLGASAAAEDRLVVCGAEEVFILPADIEVAREADRSWRWTAADSPEIPETLPPPLSHDRRMQTFRAVYPHHLLSRRRRPRASRG